MKTSERFAVGVDLGATNVRVVVGDEEGRILSRLSEATEVKQGPMGVSRQIARMIRSVPLADFQPESVRGIGIGSAGPIDLKRGVLTHPPNLPFDHVPLVEPLREEFRVPVRLLNDCTAAVLGEKKFGAGKKLQNLVYVTLSTGIGGGVYVDDRLLLGKDGNAAEIGHFTIDFEGCLRCGCGKRGHWEAYCSASNIPNYVRLLLEEKDAKAVEKSLLMKLAEGNRQNITAKGLYEAAKAGDALSRKIVERIGELNSMGFANIINAYDPALVTVGGAMALSNRDLIIEPIKKHVHQYVINRVPEIRITPLEEEVVLYGALAMVYAAES